MTRRLHIGGQVAKEGWEVLDALPGDCVDHVMNANDLSVFEDETFDEIYASHIFEHLDFTGEAQSALKDWARVLKPGGRAYISIPNLDVLFSIFLDKKNVSLDDRIWAMKVIYGGHQNDFDYHYAGYDWEMFRSLLGVSGFSKAKLVEQFGLFDDFSNMQFRGIYISLNVVATK